MKRIICVIICIISLLCMLCACQATPERPIVVGKNQEVMIEKATEEDSENIPLSEIKEESNTEHYAVTLVSEKGDVTVNIDAEITLPEVDEIPMAEIARGEITQEMTAAVLKNLLQGEKLYKKTNDTDRRMIMEHIQMLSDIKSGVLPEPETFVEDLSDPDKIDSEIEFFQGWIEGCPDSIVGEEVPLNEVTPAQSTDGEIDFGYCAEVDGCRTAAYLIEHDEVSEWELSFGMYDGIYSQDGIPVCIYDPDYVERSPRINGLSEAEAIETADRLLKDSGINYMCCIEAQESLFDLASYDANRSEKGWLLEYGRVVNGVPIILKTDGTLADDGEYARSWSGERMMFYVTDRGVIGFRWYSPYEVIGTVSEDAKLLGVDEIKRIFEKMILIENNWVNKNGDGKNSLKIDIDSIELGLTRIMKQNEHDKALLVPTWVFTGRKHYKGTKGGVTNDREPQLIINAIDGSIIDTAKGY